MTITVSADYNIAKNSSLAQLDEDQLRTRCQRLTQELENKLNTIDNLQKINQVLQCQVDILIKTIKKLKFPVAAPPIKLKRKKRRGRPKGSKTRKEIKQQ